MCACNLAAMTADARQLVRLRLAAASTRLAVVSVCVVAVSAGCGQSTSPVQPSQDNPSSPPSPQLNFSGQVMEPAANLPVEGARVCVYIPRGLSPVTEPYCTLTGADGRYLLMTDRPDFPGNVSSVRLFPSVAKESFEIRQSPVPWDFSNFMTWSPGLQRVLRVEAGASIEGTVYPQEGSGFDDDYCEGCKRIQIAAQQAGKLAVRFSAERADLRLALSQYDRRSLDAPIPVQAGEIVLMFVIGSVVPTRFELSTSLTSER